MSDELIAKLRKMADRKMRHDYGIGHYWNAVDEAADALEAALAREARLREALRDLVIYFSGYGLTGPTVYGCELCKRSWAITDDELHAPGCLAAPVEPADEGER